MALGAAVRPYESVAKAPRYVTLGTLAIEPEIGTWGLRASCFPVLPRTLPADADGPDPVARPALDTLPALGIVVNSLICLCV
jgi:hypothetical protein